MNFRSRLTSLMIQRGINATQLALELGISRQAVSFWRTGRNIPEPAKMKALADFFHVDPLWLSKGEGTAPGGVEAHADDVLPPEGYVPIKGYRIDFAAGDGHGQPEWIEDDNTDVVWYKESYFTSRGLDWRKCRRARVLGDSMEPTVCDGDEVTFIEEADPRQSCVRIRDGSIYVLSIDDSLKIKRLSRGKDGITVVSDNSSKYQPETYRGEECDRLRIYGRVIRISRSI